MWARLTSPNTPRDFLSVKTLCNETISFDSISIFFCASSILASLSNTDTKVLLVFSKFSSKRSLTRSFINLNRYSIFSFN